LKIISKWDRGL